MSDDRKKNNRIYGRGYRDGLAAAAETLGVEMNAEKHRQLVEGLNGIARKVHEALSETVAQSLADTCAAMNRMTGSKPDHSVVNGCLHSLVDKRLAVETMKGLFRRVPVRSYEPPPAISIAVASGPVDTAVLAMTRDPERLLATVKPMAAPIEQMAKIEQHLRVLADEAREQAKALDELADSVADAGIGAQEFVEGVRKDAETVKRFKELLKDA